MRARRTLRAARGPPTGPPRPRTRGRTRQRARGRARRPHRVPPLAAVAVRRAAAHGTGRRDGAGTGPGIVHDSPSACTPTAPTSGRSATPSPTGVTVGAPPDAFQPAGPGLEQPPLAADQLAEVAYAPFATWSARSCGTPAACGSTTSSGCSGSGDPSGTRRRRRGPTSVRPRRPHRDPGPGGQRAGAVLVGEDLGTVEPWVRDYLADRGILGSAVLWFEYDGERPKAPRPTASWPWRASRSTTCRPPRATSPRSTSRCATGSDCSRDPSPRSAPRTRPSRNASSVSSATAGCWPRVADEQATVEALTATWRSRPRHGRRLPRRRVGDRRTQNQPGTSDEYPKLADAVDGADGKVVLLDDLADDVRAQALARAVDEALRS